MPDAVHTYHFGRLNLLGATYEGKEKYIFNALNANVFIENRQFKYLIANVQEFRAEHQHFVYGTLVKYKELLEGTVVDEHQKTLQEDGLPDGVVKESKFFLHYQSSVVAYRPVRSRISDNQFRQFLALLIQTGQNNLMVSADVETIDEELTIKNAIQELVTIERISIDLHPTNPSNREEYASVDERLKRLKARRIRELIEAQRGGFDKSELQNDESYKGIIMASDGYGFASVSGVNKENRQVTITTGDSPVTARVIDYENPSLILDALLPTFKRIWARMQNEN